MKAVICTKFGSPDVLQLKEIEKPTIKENEILIKIHATTVTSGDTKIRSFEFPAMYWLPSRIMFGFNKPKKTILGSELAGVIEAIGKNVKRFKIGDQIFGYSGHGFGTNAEYICLHEDAVLAIKPTTLTFEEAAAVPVGASTAFFFLKKATIRSGQKVLIYGASGSVGTYAIQLAKYFGAEVTGVCSTRNIDLVKSLGADHVLDYTKEEFTIIRNTYDVIFDTIGKSSFSDCKKSLKKNGAYLLGAVWKVSVYARAFWTSITSKKNIVPGVAALSNENLEFLKELLEAGKIKPVIDRTYPLEQIADAHGYVDQGHKKGNVVIIIN